LAAAVLVPIANAASAADKAAAEPPKTGAQPAKPAPKKPQVKLVDINSASRTELKTLPGVGDPEADKIVAARPYSSKADLVTKKVVEWDTWVGIKDRIVAANPQLPKSK